MEPTANGRRGKRAGAGLKKITITPWTYRLRSAEVCAPVAPVTFTSHCDVVADQANRLPSKLTSCLKPTMPPSDHLFDQAIALTRTEDAVFSGNTCERYWNASSPFGGATVAVILHALLLHPQRMGDPIAMTVNFISPIREGRFSIHLQPVRTGRSTQHWKMELRQEGTPHPAVTGTAVFGVRRPTWSDTERTMPDAPPPETLAGYCPPLKLPFLDQYDIRYVGEYPLLGRESSTTRCWISDSPLRQIDFPAIASYCDCFLPRISVRRKAPPPISTITMSINFHVDSVTLADRVRFAVLGEASTNVFNGGLYDQEGILWSDDGLVLATTHQVVWFRD